MKTLQKKIRFLFPVFVLLCFASCNDKEYGANPYDSNTPITVSQMPKVISFSPQEGKAGDTIIVKGINFNSASAVTFGGRDAASFEILSDTVLSAVVSVYGSSGTVSVTNHKGTMFLNGFIYIKPITPGNISNLALEKPVSASSEFTPATLGVDGDEKSRWSADDKDNQWYLVDLQSTYDIKKVIIEWEGAYCGDYSVAVSTDNVNYVSVFSTTSGDGGIDEINFSPTTARYVKVVMNKKATPWNISFFELKIYK